LRIQPRVDETELKSLLEPVLGPIECTWSFSGDKAVSDSSVVGDISGDMNCVVTMKKLASMDSEKNETLLKKNETLLKRQEMEAKRVLFSVCQTVRLCCVTEEGNILPDKSMEDEGILARRRAEGAAAAPKTSLQILGGKAVSNKFGALSGFSMLKSKVVSPEIAEGGAPESWEELISSISTSNSSAISDSDESPAIEDNQVMEEAINKVD
jgi:hypothetical protein